VSCHDGIGLDYFRFPLHPGSRVVAVPEPTSPRSLPGGRSGWDSSTNAVRGEPLTHPTAQPARWQGAVAESSPGCISPVRSEAPPGGGKLQQGGNVRVMQRVIILLRKVNGQPETAAHWGP
jgi:hypothetical protein